MKRRPGEKKQCERQKKKREANMSEITRIAIEARAAGMSYGEYVARTRYGMR